MPEPRLSRTARLLKESRGSASGSSKTEPVVQWGAPSDSVAGFPSTDTIASDTATKIATSAKPSISARPTPESSLDPTVSLSSTVQPSARPTPSAKITLFRDYVPYATYSFRPDLLERLDEAAVLFSCPTESMVGKILDRLASGGGNWSERTIEDAVEFYLDNFIIRPPAARPR